ncbi:DgyrCDS7466 [Dimorphilus gyrociliatus]|uniref:DgyrCDS7466 n=1 Tax=Dimorphilus gyrociliatus TaxID=2664684 RepID=A0A7I8VR39_9ANNE|nr:DgyrCDS7466 [Dimorphilus gyrociliatus]
MNSVNNECENLRYLNRKYIEYLKAGQKKAHQLIMLTKSSGNVETSKHIDQIELYDDPKVSGTEDFETFSRPLMTKDDINTIWVDKDSQKDARMKLNCSKEFSATIPRSILKNTTDRSEERSVSALDCQEKKNDRKKKLLFSDGNDRQNASTVLELAKRKQKDTLNQKPSSDDYPTTVNTCLWTRGKNNDPLLGYDWIAANLENDDDHNLDDKSENYFEELRQFRNLHRKECMTSANPSKILGLDVERPISPEISDPGHKCIHGFTINKRLFTEPIYSDEQGRSVCPVCHTTRKEPVEDDPGFVRVSIPRSTLEQAYRFRPRAKGYYEGTDSCSLAAHCQTGWEICQPHIKKPPSNLDLKYSKRNPGDFTVADVEKIAQSHSRRSRLTDELLGKAHSFRLEQNGREDKEHLSFSGVSTRYPVF